MLFERLKNIIRASIADVFSGSSDSNLDIEEIEREYEKLKRERQKKEQQQQYHPPRNQQEEKERQYYADLELPYGASFEEIKKSYRRLIKQYHPDKYANERSKYEAAVKITTKLNEAYMYFENKYQKS